MYVIIIIINIINYIYIHVPIHSQIIHNRAVKSPSKVDFLACSSASITS